MGGRCASYALPAVLERLGNDGARRRAVLVLV